ncbi:uncharacterized protein DUF4249 [Gelidibacter algens]|uniref:Uncharacterized protein DUF4249 n=1 Tax=Gelidibacter algens TaxID=49280 RepID=A0A1A7QPU8_9FLAO|nr:DUF4249 domain-containing protein [Gelidibacter algens]OBX21363.1 hypothetical protein A9996_18210 [Gelidibacter algens]RAJ25096.1 uncharacterized protein DUF4249 [Gelidibacter algens]
MKKILIILSLIAFVSCEDVITVDLETEAPRLVIDANINWEKGTSGATQTILLSLSHGYYDNTIPKVSGATVYVTNSENSVFDFIEEPATDLNSGRYTCENFVPVLGETYTLTVIHKGQTYRSTEKLMATPDITSVEQRSDLGLNNDEIGIKVFWNDIPNERNYYLVRFESVANAFPEYTIIDDRYNQGNVMNELYGDEDLEVGNTVNIILYGISERYSNYMGILIAASTGGGGGPFQVTPSAVKGNIVNQTNTKDYAYGYFRLGETDTLPYEIQ